MLPHWPSLSDLAYLQDNLCKLQTERQRLLEALATIPYLLPYPSSANFILCKVIGRDAAALKTELASQHGILVRYFSTPGLQDHIRISIGRPSDTRILMEALSNWRE